MLYLSFSCQETLNLNVNGETIKDFGIPFNGQIFGITTPSDTQYIEYVNTEIRYQLF